MGALSGKLTCKEASLLGSASLSTFEILTVGLGVSTAAVVSGVTVVGGGDVIDGAWGTVTVGAGIVTIGVGITGTTEGVRSDSDTSSILGISGRLNSAPAGRGAGVIVRSQEEEVVDVLVDVGSCLIPCR